VNCDWWKAHPEAGSGEHGHGKHSEEGRSERAVKTHKEEGHEHSEKGHEHDVAKTKKKKNNQA